MNQEPVTRLHGSRDLTFNHKRLYRLVCRSGQVSRADLMRQSSLTFPSVSRLVNELVAAGIIREGAKRRGGMGKPPTELTVDPTHAYSVGFHLSSGQAAGRFVNALGEPFKDFSVPAASLTEGITSVLIESDLDATKLAGACLSTSDEPFFKEELERLASALAAPVFAESSIAASVKAERYFGAGELDRFVYLDAVRLELGAVVDGTELARPGTLDAIFGERAPSIGDLLPGALRGAAALVQAEALVVGGLNEEDLAKLRSTLTDLLVVPACAEASDPVLAAAAVPLAENFGV